MAFLSASSALMPFTRVGARVMFLFTLRCGNTLKCWNTMPIFCLCRSMSTFFPVISTPSKNICPCSGVSSRFRHRRKVLLPPPEGPITDTTSPECMASDTPFRTCNLPKLL